MGTLISAIADILSRIFSNSGIQMVAGSPNQLGEIFSNMISAWLREWRKQPKPPKPSGYVRKATGASRVLRGFLPVVLYTGTLVALVIVAIVSLAFVVEKHSWNWDLWFWIFLVSIIVSALPLISRVWLRNWSRLGLVLELIILSMALMFFATLVLHLPAVHLWSLFAVLLIVLICAGGRGVEVVHRQTEQELLSEWKGPPANPAANGPTEAKVKTQLTSIRQYFSQELIVYAALPAGVIGSFFFLLWGRWWAIAPPAVVAVCLRCVFGMAALLILYFLLASFRRMIDPTLGLASPPDLKTGTPAALDWGCVMTAYRKMFLLDAMENVVLLATLCLLEWLLLGGRDLSIRDPKLITIGVAATIMLNEIPYLIGQWRVHELLSTWYRGWERITKMREAAENIPLVPKLEFIAALLGEASAGGLALEITKRVTEFISGPASGSS